MLDAVLPPRCFSCGEQVLSQGDLCGACWAGLDFFSGVGCACCGFPFEVDIGDDALCGPCIKKRPLYARARAVMRYDDNSRPMVLAFKNSDRHEGVDIFGKWMAGVATGQLHNTDIIIPVPLHRKRLFYRRYNQAALMAKAIGKQMNIEVDVNGLIRNKPTKSQGHLRRKERFKNVRAAFSLTKKGELAIKDKHILLVDDVLTTGATVGACTKVLMGKGAASVQIITLTRVVQTQKLPI
jgi:ComF family protein